jgi:mRNA interferase HicA
MKGCSKKKLFEKTIKKQLIAAKREAIAKRAKAAKASFRKKMIKYGAYLIRQGQRHSIYQREAYKTEVPRHNEIVDELARKICKDLNIPFVR